MGGFRNVCVYLIRTLDFLYLSQSFFDDFCICICFYRFLDLCWNAGLHYSWSLTPIWFPRMSDHQFQSVPFWYVGDFFFFFFTCSLFGVWFVIGTMWSLPDDLFGVFFMVFKARRKVMYYYTLWKCIIYQVIFRGGFIICQINFFKLQLASCFIGCTGAVCCDLTASFIMWVLSSEQLESWSPWNTLLMVFGHHNSIFS